MQRPTLKSENCETCEGTTIVFWDPLVECFVSPTRAGPFPRSNMWCCPECDGGWDRACENGGYWEILLTKRAVAARERERA